MRKKVEGAKPPDELPARIIEAVYATLAKPLDVTFLSEVPLGVMTHWMPTGKDDGKRSIVCLGKKDCDLCKAGHADWWIGYLGAYDHRRRCRVAVTLSLRTWETLKALPVDDEPLYGIRVIMARLENRANGPVGCKRAESPPQSPPMSSPDLMPTLRALYGAGVECWFPPARKTDHEEGEPG